MKIIKTTKLAKKQDQLPGGLADEKSFEDLVKHHGGGKDLEDKLRKELSKGTEAELEHIDDLQLAEEIAMDHLWEDAKYYAKLEKIHKEASWVAKFEDPATQQIMKMRPKQLKDSIKKSMDTIHALISEGNTPEALDKLDELEKTLVLTGDPFKKLGEIIRLKEKLNPSKPSIYHPPSVDIDAPTEAVPRWKQISPQK
jgi:hypothetical protein